MANTQTRDSVYQQLKMLGMSTEEIEDEIALLIIAGEIKEEEGDDHE